MSAPPPSILGEARSGRRRGGFYPIRAATVMERIYVVRTVIENLPCSSHLSYMSDLSDTSDLSDRSETSISSSKSPF